MTNQELLLLITLFVVKHFVVDFLLQTKWQWSNKHKLGHPGGIFHSWLHGITTVLILTHFKVEPSVCFIIGSIEWIVHYFIDYFKMVAGICTGWKCDNSPYFWWLLGFDQLLHYLTYIVIIYNVLTLL